MFHSARLKLTAWYLLIIMLISAVFSVVIYREITREVERSLRLQQFRIERQHGIFLPPFVSPPLDPQLIVEATDRIKLTLFIINVGILVVSGAAGYFLAGKTLQPIEEMVDEQNRFITDASHELRTPLTALKTTIEVGLRDTKLSLKDSKDLLISNLDDVNSLQSLSDSLIRLAQYQKPNGNLIFEKVSLHTILEDAHRKVATLARDKHIVIINKVSGLDLAGDYRSLVELFVILLDNAIKYSSPATQVTLTARKADSSVSIWVKDQGVGIKETDIDHIFDRFYRTDKSRSKETVAGYGLGLSIAKKIVTDHSGSISVTSNVGKGSTFVIELPLKPNRT